MFHHAASVLKTVVATTIVAFPLAASAGPLLLNGASPAVGGGAAWDSPAGHVDSNTSASPYSGVVSIFLEQNGGVSICSGALIGKRSVLSAAHCVDSNGRGQVVDLNDPEIQMLVVFNSDGDYNAIMRPSSVSMHANYQGFAVCPDGTRADCLNDDVAVINLAEDAPASARIYKLAVTPFAQQQIYLAGYGFSGDGINGLTTPPEYSVKRVGLNFMDRYQMDDEFTLNKEVWFADYDGNGLDAHCANFGICTPVFDDPDESTTAPGDSGGPMFIHMYGELMIAGTSTFGYYPAGHFGTMFGGMLVSAYGDYLADAADSHLTFVPEPNGMLTFALGAGMLAAVRVRRRRD